MSKGRPQECCGLSAGQEPHCGWQWSQHILLCRQPVDNLSPEERDARTVLCMQLAARIRPRDLEEFFSAVGKVALSPEGPLSHLVFP